MLTDLIRLLRGRAEQCRGNANAYDASRYHAEAVLQRAKAVAFDCAADDAEQAERVERADRDARVTLPPPVTEE